MEDELNLQIEPYEPRRKTDIFHPNAYRLKEGQNLSIFGYFAADVVFAFDTRHNLLCNVDITLQPPSTATDTIALFNYYFQQLTERYGSPRATFFRSFDYPVSPAVYKFTLPMHRQDLNLNELYKIYLQHRRLPTLTAIFDNIELGAFFVEFSDPHESIPLLYLSLLGPLDQDGKLYQDKPGRISSIQHFSMYDSLPYLEPIEILEPMPTLPPETTPYTGFPGYREMGL